MPCELPLAYAGWVGIDISKAQLDLYSNHPDLKLPSSVSNSIEGHQKLLKLIAHFSEIKIIFEATGGYEKSLLLTLQKAAIHATRINPAQVRSFAKAKGLLAKTDKIDAKLPAHYGELFAPKATLPIDPDSRPDQIPPPPSRSTSSRKNATRTRALQTRNGHDSAAHQEPSKAT